MSEYKVQIIMPVYNSSKTLCLCLDSLLAQSFKDWQVIMVDDCSTDNSLEIIHKYQKDDDRFRLIALKKNSGASNARNAALEVVDAEYVAFLDSDDYWESTMLETMIGISEEKDCDVVQCRYIYDFPGGRKHLPAGAFKEDVLLEGKELKKVFVRMMTGINMNHVCMKLIRASLIKDLRFNTSLPTAEDLEMCVRIFDNVKRYYFISKAFYHYCRHENSLTGSGLSFKKKFLANIKVSKVMVEHLEEWGMNSLFYRFLAIARPYTIIGSKVFRIICEKLLKEN